MSCWGLVCLPCFSQYLIKCSWKKGKTNTALETTGKCLHDYFGLIFNLWVKRDLLKSIFFNIIISNILKKCQYFSSQIFCNSLLPKVNLPQQALCFGMTSTTLIKTHEIITVFLSGIPFCSNGAAFDSKHPMETKPILQSSYSSHQRCGSSLY